VDSITTDKTSYTVREKIVASFTFANPAVNDYIAIYDSTNAYVNSQYTCGGTTPGVCPPLSSGSLDFYLSVAGTYYIGTYDAADNELKYTQITVNSAGPVSVSTDKTLYTLGEFIVISYQSNPAKPTDYASVWSCPPTEVNYGYQVINSVTAGTILWSTGPGGSVTLPGCYVAYLQDGDTDIVYAQSPQFNINA